MSATSAEGLTLYSRLEEFFREGSDPRAQLSDNDIGQISTKLRASRRVAWSRVPRLYAVLRTINQLQLLDDIIDHGVNDYWFPFDARSVRVTSLSSVAQNQFLEAQRLVLTRAVDLEKGTEKRHHHFSGQDTIPFNTLGELGRGAYSKVDRVLSQFSRREFARKTFRRQRGGDRIAIRSFINELSVLKRIQHQHCVELVASYTDAKYFGIIISPVADSNLQEYYDRALKDAESTKVLGTFFGCLISALNYLHTEQIRHRDIKPQNILVKGRNVYLTDFGISLDWQYLSRSTTDADSAKTVLYSAPEVVNQEPRNSSSDIWSLGCVFLELCTVLKKQSLEEMRQFFKARSEAHAYYRNLPAIQDWLMHLRKCGPELDNGPLNWTASMLKFDPRTRPLALALYETISRFKVISDGEKRVFCADCCIEDDEQESIVDSLSDGDLWAGNEAAGFTCPQETSEGNKANDLGSSPDEDVPSVKRRQANPDLLQGSFDLFKTHQAISLPREAAGPSLHPPVHLDGVERLQLADPLIRTPKNVMQPGQSRRTNEKPEPLRDSVECTNSQGFISNLSNSKSMPPKESLRDLVGSEIQSLGATPQPIADKSPEQVDSPLVPKDANEILVKLNTETDFLRLNSEALPKRSKGASKTYIWSDVGNLKLRMRLLTEACGNGDVVIVHLLLARDVDFPRSRMIAPLQLAVAGAYVKIVQHLLNIFGGQPFVNNRSNRKTALFIACSYSHSEVARILLDHGADPNLSYLTNNTCLYEAVKNKNTQIVQLLLDANAKVDVRSNPRGLLGETPLSLARRTGQTDVERLLLEAQARQQTAKKSKVPTLA